jgi:hypothetical protein
MTNETEKKQTLTGFKSPTCREIKPVAVILMATEPAARPLNPSMRLIALAIPPKAKPVNKTQMKV